MSYLSTANKNKRRNISDVSSITLGYLHTRKGSRKKKHEQRLRILFNTGCGETIISNKVLRNLETTRVTSSKWSTKAGTFKTSKTCKISFMLPMFHKHRDITWTAHVDDSHSTPNRYDLIVGRDLMTARGLDIKFSTCSIAGTMQKCICKNPRGWKVKMWINLCRKCF